MENNSYFLLLLCAILGTGLAYTHRPWAQRLHQLAMERQLERESGNMRSTAQQALGETIGCKSVVADSSHTSSVVNKVHVCEFGSGLCYISSLGKCCGESQSFLKLSGSTGVQLGARSFDVNFFLNDFLQSAASSVACFSIPDDIQPCSKMDALCNCGTIGCTETIPVCVDFALVDTCDLNGCQCQAGYKPPYCCICAPGYFRSIDGSCKRRCDAGCAIRTPDGGCQTCRDGYQGEGCCNCTEGLVIDSRGRCGCPPDQVKVNGKCDEVCRTNCEEGTFSSGSGCGGCKTGYVSTPRCCDCDGDLEKDSEGRCVCPSGIQPNSDNECISIECGRNQDIIFVLDASASFDNPNFIHVLEIFQYIFGSLLKDSSNNMQSELIFYPKRENDGDVLLVDRTMTCEVAVNKLIEHSYNILLSINPLSRNTRADLAMEYLKTHLSSTDKMTTILTISDGPTDGNEETNLNLIRNAINGIKAAHPGNTFRFLSVGFLRNDESRLRNELLALADSKEGNYFLIDGSLDDFITQIISTLRSTGVLCNEQADSISPHILERVLNTCVDQQRLNGGRYQNCYQSNLCSQSLLGEELELHIERAIEQALHHVLEE